MARTLKTSLCLLLLACSPLPPEEPAPLPRPTPGSPAGPRLPLRRELLAKAAPDECFAGIGQPYPPGPPCATGQPKVNQSYLWGLGKVGQDVWLETVANTPCLVAQETFARLGMAPSPFATRSLVCEFDRAASGTGDYRPPRIHVYDLARRRLIDLSEEAGPLLAQTLGIRSVGVLGDIVILGGPTNLVGAQAINLFAFDVRTRRLIGATTLSGYSDIRRWASYGGVYYAGVGRSGGGGAVLRWRGRPSDPFRFEEVGTLTSEAAELVAHEGRLFATTWPVEVDFGREVAALVMSPRIPPGGLTAAQARAWDVVWRVTDYEPDPVTAAIYQGGALASFGGHLYWGTLNAPLSGAAAHFFVYGPPSSELDAAKTVLGAHRATIVLRGRDFGTRAQKLELLYGERILPVYQGGRWQLAPTRMGEPLYGPSGFGNPFNAYTWAMEPYRGELFVGTFDWSYLAADLVRTVLASLGIDLPLPFEPGSSLLFGADLFRFPSPRAPAIPEDLGGVGNYTNYGIRNMVADDALYLGTANPMNLLTDPTDELPEGGWELLRLAPRQPAFPPRH